MRLTELSAIHDGTDRYLSEAERKTIEALAIEGEIGSASSDAERDRLIEKVKTLHGEAEVYVEKAVLEDEISAVTGTSGSSTKTTKLRLFDARFKHLESVMRALSIQIALHQENSNTALKA